jgi:hypothetical protein
MTDKSTVHKEFERGINSSNTLLWSCPESFLPFATETHTLKSIYSFSQLNTNNILNTYIYYLLPATYLMRGGAVVKALLYKPEGRGFDSRWCHWIFSLT